MSSESDADEFYDAADRTPTHLRLRSPSQISTTSITSTDTLTCLDELEEQEQQLLTAQRQAEERRREEDAELQLRFNELEHKKQRQRARELAQQQEAARRAAEIDLRRQKLANVRRDIQMDTSPATSDPSPSKSASSDDVTLNIGQPDESLVPARLYVNLPPERPGFSMREMLDSESKPPNLPSPTLDYSSRSGCGIDNIVNDLCSEERAFEAVASTSSQAQSSFSPSSFSECFTTEQDSARPTDGMVSPDIECYPLTYSHSEAGVGVSQSAESSAPSLGYHSACVANLNLHQAHQDKQKVATKHLPGFMFEEVSKEVKPDSEVDVTPDSDVFVTPGDEVEPDLIASVRVKAAPPPRPPPPVVPPRKKKASTSVELPPDDCPPPSRGLPECPSRTSLTSEPGLNMESATSLSCYVTATETPSSKAEKTCEEEVEERRGHPEGESVEGGGLGVENRRAMVRMLSELRAATLPASYKTDQGGVRATVTRGEGPDTVHVNLEQGRNTESLEMTRPRSHSGSRLLSDKEILDMVMVLNLDTHESVPLSQAEEKLPRGVNPLSLHIMRRTKEYSSATALRGAERPSDDDDDDACSVQSGESMRTIGAVKPIKKRRVKLKRLLGRTVNKLKAGADRMRHAKDATESSDEEDDSLEGRRMIKIKASSHHKGPYDFDLLVPVQDLAGEHNGAVWTMKFSHCGRVLATGGQDNLLRIWVLKPAFAFFDDMRQKFNEASSASRSSPHSSQDSVSSHSSEGVLPGPQQEDDDDDHAPFMNRPFSVYKGHTGDILDLSWSKNYFILTSSMDKTVRLWHVSRRECLCCFQHIDFVTAIAFHPKDDRYFLSGSLDGKLRLWSIPDKKVAKWNEVIGQSKLITAANFCRHGKFAVAGTYDGRCVFYVTDQFKYYTQIHVRSTRGKNSRGRKITGIESMPWEDKLLVTSNDSRIRLYDLRDLTLSCKYKGAHNNSSQIKAHFNHNGRWVVCGSENSFVYIWRTQHTHPTARRDRSQYWEGIRAHQTVVTAAIFAPHPGQIIRSQFEYMDADEKDADAPDLRGEVLVTADFTGHIKVFINKFKPGSG